MRSGDQHLIIVNRLLVTDELDIENLSRDAIGAFVVFQRERDPICVIFIKQLLIQSNLGARAAVKDILRKFIQGLEYVHIHCLANGVLPLYVR